jgi:hypothetical protein
VVKVFEAIHMLKCVFEGHEILVPWWRHGFSPISFRQMPHYHFRKLFEKQHRVERTGGGVIACYPHNFQRHGYCRVLLKIESVCWRGDMASELVDFRIASLIIGVHREFSKSVIERGGQGKEVMSYGHGAL